MSYTGLPQIWAVVPAAGSGARMRSEIPKQYLPLLNHSVIDITLSKLANIEMIEGIVVALGEHDTYWEQTQASRNAKVYTVLGGRERSDSVLAGIQYCQRLADNSAPPWVVVHDAARPCVSEKKVTELIHTCLTSPGSFSAQGAILGVPCADTVKRVKNQEIAQTEDRSQLWLAHTPQCFPADLLESALLRARENSLQVTDEASAIEAQGGRVALVNDRRDNIKITVPEDLVWAETVLRQQGFAS